jgi:single-stranded-DNA-specific exonuclease
VEPIVYIPDRLMEGYGPSGAALVELRSRGASLAVTVDCGAQAFEALEEAKAAGLDVIVVDHHQCATLLPVAVAMINPNRLDESESARARPSRRGRNGVPARRRAASRTQEPRLFLRQAASRRFSTCSTSSRSAPSPMSPSSGLNRAFVTQGLKVMAARQNIGLSALAEAARLVKPPSCRDLGFALGPRINAGGRVGKSDLGVRLLTCTDPEEARTIAAELDRLNEERRAIEMTVCEQAEEQAARLNGAAVITVMAGGWHQGVIGIVAGRLKERFGRPAIVIAECEDGTGKGSGRSISGVDLGAAVLAAKDSGLLIAGGGHAMAAGLTLPRGGLEPFRDFISERLRPMSNARATAAPC